MTSERRELIFKNAGASKELVLTLVLMCMASFCKHMVPISYQCWACQTLPVICGCHCCVLCLKAHNSFCRIPCLPFVMASLAFALLGLPTLVAAAKPHVLFILADDYGWGNMGVHRRDAGSSPEEIQGKAEVHTPNIDALIDAGIHLDHHYTYKICSPSRSSIQSGRMAVHVNPINSAVTSQNYDDPVSGYAGIPRNMTGIAEKMRDAGYRTHLVGKWDAGMATPEHSPKGRGYETWYGYYQHANDYWHKSTVFFATGGLPTKYIS